MIKSMCSRKKRLRCKCMSLLIFLFLLPLFSCASGKIHRNYPLPIDKRSQKLKEKLATELKITKLPTPVNLIVTKRSKSYSVTKRPKSSYAILTVATIPAGQQLMKGIRKAANLVFSEVYESGTKQSHAVLKVRLRNFDFEHKYVKQHNLGALAAYESEKARYESRRWSSSYRKTFGPPRPPRMTGIKLHYKMRMNVITELISNTGTVIYQKDFSVSHEGWGKTYSNPPGRGDSYHRKDQTVLGEANAILVGIWVRGFVEDITQNKDVQRFAQSFLSPAKTVRVRVPEIIITSPTDGSTTDRSEVVLTGTINSASAIKEWHTSLNGRPLTETRGIVLKKKDNVVSLNQRIPLIRGENVITVIASNEDGGVGQKIVRITRKEPALIASKDIGSSGQIGERWAVVVGVSKYRHRAKGISELKSAASDARAFAEFLKSSRGGNFKGKNVLLLTDEQATSAALRRALFTFLKRAIEEDLVIFFFSGQGASEIEGSDNYYLLTYDADPNDLPSTAIPVWDVDIAFRRNIKAKRTVILADACHISNIGRDQGSRAMPGNNLINKYIHALSEAGEGRAIFTATQVGQVGIEKALRGRKTGLFTHYLLEALSGLADENGDGVVTLGETIDYTTNLVHAASRGKQRPTVAGRFDRNLPLALTK